MLKLNHNDESKKFMQKILLFIDSVLVNATSENSEQSSKTLTSGLLNVRDAIFSEIMKDNQISQFNKVFKEQSKKKLEENQKDINLETKSVKDQSE